MFATTREVLKQSGPKVGASRNSVGGIAIAVLNNGLRPFLTKWHPLLQEWELKKKAEVSLQQHERSWEHEQQLRQELEKLRNDLAQYADALAKIANIEN
jgi:cobalamin-dependent methionine synthase I